MAHGTVPETNIEFSILKGNMMKTAFALILVFSLFTSLAMSQQQAEFSRAGWSDLAVGTVLEGSGASSGVAWGDYDHDGLIDIYLSQYDQPNQLFHNEGNGIFTEATGTAANDPGSSTCSYWGDYDDDGLLDIYVLQRLQGNRLYQNTADFQFLDATLPVMEDTGDVWGGALVDYDADGRLDLYCSNFNGANQLLHNDGNGNFSSVPGVLDFNSGSQACSWADYDNDGDQDVYIVNGGGYEANTLYRNDGQDLFTEVNNSLLNNMGAGQGAAWGDYDNDGDLDLYLTNWGSGNKLLRNDGNDNFSDATSGPLGMMFVNCQSAVWGDYDNDGDLDLFVASYGFANSLLENDGTGNFIDVTDQYPILADTDNSVGAAWADCDNDGDLDLFVSNYLTECRLYANNLDNGNHWLHLKLVGDLSNRSAIGARVRIVAGGNAWIREVNGGTGYMSQNSLLVEFGLGSITSVDSVQVTWPYRDGEGEYQVSSRTDVAVDQIVIILEPGGSLSSVPGVLPAGYVLHSNYPNPFNPQTSIRFDLPETAQISLNVYDLAGHLVRTLISNETRIAGQYEVPWNGQDSLGQVVSAGVYFYRLDVGNGSESRRMILVK